MPLRGAPDAKSQIYYVHDLEGKIWGKITFHTVKNIFFLLNIGSYGELSLRAVRELNGRFNPEEE